MGIRKPGRTEHRFRHRGTLQPPTGFDALATASVGPGSLVVALWAAAIDHDNLFRRDQGPGGASFAATRTAPKQRVALATYQDGHLRPDVVSVVSGFPLAFPLLQPLPGGDHLVAGSRCSWRPEGPERNGLVVDANGTVLRAGTLGDGIAHLLVDKHGEIWIGYSDEGVFGNFGWGNPGPAPLGAPGIVKWSSNFEKLWEYRGAESDDPIADCYALNVDDDETWACPYTDFPVVVIRDGEVAVHPTTGVAGPQGILVAGGTVGLLGTYRDRGLFLIGSLGDLPQLQKSSLLMPTGAKPPRGQLVCRGSRAHLFIGPEWFSFDLAPG